jgi:hypothetical protein
MLGHVLSGDGTTHRAVNYESKYVTLRVPDYKSRALGGDPSAMMSVPADRFFGISSAPNHTSETQLEGWAIVVREFFELYNNTQHGGRMLARLEAFAAKIKGMHTDHAEDQKKLARLVRAWKDLCDRELRGELLLLSTLPEDLLPILVQESQQKIEDAGGADAWAVLSEKEQADRNAIIYKKLCTRFGQSAYDALTEEEKNEVDFFIWAGCCMHKELNSVKGGNMALVAFWEKAGITAPIPLMNRDNTAAAELGSSEAKTRAEKVTQAGAMKTTSLAGAIFNHKDDKKGHHDVWMDYIEDKLGHLVSFPDTSNTRYQTYCLGACCLILYLPCFVEFLEQVRDKKDSGLFNHMEQNVYRALQDIPTITELCVLAIYSQIISAPYMRSVRGPGHDTTNLLDMGPLHDKVLEHC